MNRQKDEPGKRRPQGREDPTLVMEGSTEGRPGEWRSGEGQTWGSVVRQRADQVKGSSRKGRPREGLLGEGAKNYTSWGRIKEGQP